MRNFYAMENEFTEVLGVIAKLDRLKSTMRDSATLDGSKKENSAEHSWQCAIMALLFQRFRLLSSARRRGRHARRVRSPGCFCFDVCR